MLILSWYWLLQTLNSRYRLHLCTENRLNWVPELKRLKCSVVSLVSADHRKDTKREQRVHQKDVNFEEDEEEEECFYSTPDHFGLSCRLWQLCSQLPCGFVMTGRWQRGRRKKKNKLRSKWRKWEKVRRSRREWSNSKAQKKTRVVCRLYSEGARCERTLRVSLRLSGAALVSTRNNNYHYC